MSILRWSGELDRIVLETKGMDLLSAITMVRVTNPKGETLFEQPLELTNTSELDMDPDLLRCVITGRLDEMLAQRRLVPVTRDRNMQWRTVPPDLIGALPVVQCGVLIFEHIDDTKPTLVAFDRTSGQVIRTIASRL